MNRKRLIVILSGVFVFVTALVISFMCYVNGVFGDGGNGNPVVDIQEMRPLTEILSKDQVIEDRDKLIEYIESVHPYFDLEEDKSEYVEEKLKFMAYCSKEMTVQQFFMACASFVNFFKDGHTRMMWNQTVFFSADFDYSDNKLFYGEEKSPVKKIDGIPVEEIFNMIINLLPIENEMTQKLYFEEYSKNLEILKLCSSNIPANYLTVSLENGQEFKITKIKNNNAGYDRTTVYEKGDVVVVDFNLCQDDEVFQKACKDLEERIKKGFKKVIIDIRGNPGGNSNTCDKLLEILGMRPPEYSVYVRYSQKAKLQNGYKKGSGNYHYRGSAKKAKQNPDIQLCVLTDCHTFSSATMLAVYVRDGKLGKIIGEPSANNPCSYGDIIYYSLPNSKISGTISHKQFIRPDDSLKKERMLVPDEQIKPEYALDRALYILGSN